MAGTPETLNRSMTPRSPLFGNFPQQDDLVKHMFNLGRMKPKDKNIDVQERVRKSVDEELALPERKNLYLLVAAGDIDWDEFKPTAHKLKTLRAIEQAGFESEASKLESSEEWFRVIPAEWIVTEFLPVLERLAIKDSIKQTIRQSKKFVRLQVTEQFDSTLSGYQLLNFATAQYARSIKGVLFEPCSFKLYHFDDWQIKEFDSPKLETPSIFPFLNVLTSRAEQRYRVTSHGLARFDLPELQLENVPESLSGSCAYLINAIAQSLIEKAVELKTKNISSLSLSEPLVVSTAAVIRGNEGKLPFQSCVPRAVELRLIMKKQTGTVKLFANADGGQEEQDANLAAVLAKLNLVRSTGTAMLEGS